MGIAALNPSYLYAFRHGFANYRARVAARADEVDAGACGKQLQEIASRYFVGWVERSDTHRFGVPDHPR